MATPVHALNPRKTKAPRRQPVRLRAKKRLRPPPKKRASRPRAKQAANRRFFVFDFDSTIVSVETLDELAKLTLKKNRKRLAAVEQLTREGMSGQRSIAETLTRRLKLIRAHQRHLEPLAELLRRSITPSFLRNRQFFKTHGKYCYIVSSGIRSLIGPVAEDLGIPQENILANDFIFDRNGSIIGVDSTNSLAKAGGKVIAVRALKLGGEVIALGDGMTDYELRKSGAVSRFFAFTECVRRPEVTAVADGVAASFDEFLFLNNLPRAVSYPKTRMKALLLEAVHPDAVAMFKDEGYQVEAEDKALSEAELARRIKDVSILGIRSKTRVSEAVFKKSRKLLAVGAFCIGTEQIANAAAARSGIAVFNAPYSNTRSVVELALGEMIMLLRRIADKSKLLHEGHWDKSAAGSFEIRGKKLGIVGYGNIGAQLSVIAEALGLDVYYYDIVEKLSLGNAQKCNSLKELLGLVDIVSVHVDGRSQNRGLIGEAEFNAMRKGAIFLNLSRGSVVDIGALAKHLKSGHLGGAGIDVYPVEPSSNRDPFESELCGLPNVILTPHIGGSTLEAQRNIAQFVTRALLAYVNSGNSFGSVNLPHIQLPELVNGHRLLHIHENVPGILAQINGILAKNKINILAQYLKTNEEIGYVITDVNREYESGVIRELSSIPSTVKFRILY